MIFTERIEKLLGANNIKAVIEEFLKFLSEVPQSNRDARSDANQLRGQVIVLSGRFTELNTKINTNIIDSDDANHEKSVLINSFIQILNQLPSNYPDLNIYLEEKNEDDAWKDAQAKNIIEAYQVYFNKYPNGKYKAATIKLIAELEDVKLKQDMEIKRLALLEKERRENDKVAAEPQRVQTGPTTQKAYRAPSPVSQTSPAPAKSRKGLYIALGAVLGIVFIIIIAVVSSKESSTYQYPEPVYDNVASNTGGPSEAVKAELMSAIKLGDNAEINAFYSLNPDYLYKSFIGEALKTGLSEIETLRASDLFMTATLDQQEFISFKLSADGLEAEVELVEVWSSMYSRISTQECFSRTLSVKLPQTMFLKKSDNGWMIFSIVHKSTETPPTTPCNSSTN